MLILILLSILFCASHSILAIPAIIQRAESAFGRNFRYYRLLYNIIALILFLMVILYARFLKTEAFFSWDGNWRMLQLVLFGSGLLLFYLGAKKYSTRSFLGIEQIKEESNGSGIGFSGRLDTEGVLQFVRHPWYLGTLLVIWARPMDFADVAMNSVFTVYIFIGTFLEEKKLVNEFGNDYLSFQQEVSMIFPWKWLLSRFKR